MTSSFAAQNYGSRNAHQSPVKSHKGGYLRCPFNISATYADLAEKRVREDLARGAGARGGAAVADKDGLLASSSASRLGDGSNDGPEGNEGRPWSRAGVGAGKLSGKEKRTQQEQAELIYGRGSLGDGDDTAGGSGSSLSHGPSQGHMFAVDTRDQAALQQVVPRAVREKVKRRRFEELKQGRTQLGHHTPFHGRVDRDGDAEGADNHSKTFSSSSANTASNRIPEAKSSTASATAASSASIGKPAHSSPNGPSQSKSPRQAPATAPSNGVQREPAKPKNRMQMLDDLRSSALTGKKRKR